MTFVLSKLRKLRGFLRNSLSFTMEVDSEDILHYSHQKLTGLIQDKGSRNEDAVIQDYLNDLKYKPVKDFNKNLEWFNVSEPLSFAKHLKGKVVVLDFFTYCCINCMHIIPELREIENEFSVEDGLVVIGVHSAKFENEKLSSNILAAVQRYNIAHPVVNDCQSEIWQNCEVHCWPTLLMLGPNGNPIVMLMGEGHKDNLRLYIRNALEFYKSKNQISNHKLPLKSVFHLLPNLKGPLLFPGKIASYFDETAKTEYLGISDTGNNRILITTTDGKLITQVGGSGTGFLDGTLQEAKFNNPQGLVFQNRHILYVADTENHAIRKIDLKNLTVETVAGTGEQGSDRAGGKLWKSQEISSPWDVCIYRTPDLDMSFHASVEETPLKDVLIIAMAGTHQIWALFLEDTIWWKFKRYNAGTCICIAGSGREENRNNQYPHAAAFAQPSGLALSVKNKEVYIADSESSSVRRLSLVDGKVTAVVGGERDPNNLFAFGDKDGTLFEAKLQHLLGLTLTKNEDTLLVADTYNHKLKRVDIVKNKITTLTGPALESDSFKEPAGLCVGVDERKLYVADTNNHAIKIVELDKNFRVNNIKTLNLNLSLVKSYKEKLNHQIKEINVLNLTSKGGKVILSIDISFAEGLKLTEDAVQNWRVVLPNTSWICVPPSGSNIRYVEIVVNVPPSSEGSGDTIDVIFNLITCTKESCYPKNFIVRQPIKFVKDEKLTEVNQAVKVSLTAAAVEIV